MYETRQQKLINEIRNERQVDIALIMSPMNIYYYTGFHSEPDERFLAFVIDAKTEKTMLFYPSLDESAAKSQAQVEEFIPMFDTENAYAKFSQKLGTNIQSIAFEKSYITVLQYEQMKDFYPQVDFFTDIEPFILSERAKKTKSEIEHVKKAIELTEKGLENTIKKLVLGMKEIQVKAELEYQLMLLGADKIAFDTIVLSGENSALPHGVASDRELERGDFLLFDFGVTINGYHSDLTRTFIIGEGTEKQIDMYETVRMANEKAIKQVEVGQPLKKIDQAARNYISEKHYGQYFTHRVGHGLGLDVHEAPSIHHENEDIIEPGLLFTIEPGIYVPEIGGVRIEDNIYINEKGEVEVLSCFRKALTYISL